MNRLSTIARFAIVASVVPQCAIAQSLADRISQVRDGSVRMSFAARPEVCGSGNSISRTGSRSMGWTSDQSSDVSYGDACSHGPVRLVMTVEGGTLKKLRTYVGGEWRPARAGTTDLGTVSVKTATDYLIHLAKNDDGSIGRDAIMPATLADSVNVWAQLIPIARNESRPTQTRKQALFWLGQAAGDATTPGRPYLTAEQRDETPEEAVKKQAVFALSQRRNGAAVPALLAVAQENRNPEVRKTALFWLGQTLDPRAVSLFEEILTARRR